MRLFWADGEPLTDADREPLCDGDLSQRMLGNGVRAIRYLRSVVLVRDDAWDHVHGDSCDAPECWPNGEVTL